MLFFSLILIFFCQFSFSNNLRFTENYTGRKYRDFHNDDNVLELDRNDFCKTLQYISICN